LVIATVLWPKISCIFLSETPALARTETAEYRKSWNRNCSTPAFLQNFLKRWPTSIGPSDFSARKTKSCLPSVRFRKRRWSRSSASRQSGIARVSPFFVSGKVASRFLRSTNRQCIPQISPRLAPVHNAMQTTSKRFRSASHSFSNRSCSSGSRKRVRWLCSGNLRSPRHGLPSIQPHNSRLA